MVSCTSILHNYLKRETKIKHPGGNAKFVTAITLKNANCNEDDKLAKTDPNLSTQCFFANDAETSERRFAENECRITNVEGKLKVMEKQLNVRHDHLDKLICKMTRTLKKMSDKA